MIANVVMVFLCFICHAKEEGTRPKDMERRGWYKTKFGWKCRACHETGL